MCGRYKLSTPGDELWETFDIHGDAPELVPHFNIAPTQPIGVIRVPHRLELLRWGIRIPNPRAGGFNVRVESLGAPFYRDSIQGRRCLILADGYYEWKTEGEGKTAKKQPLLIKRHDAKPFAFAGMWDKIVLKSGETVDAATILTTVPRGAAAEAHDRMPVNPVAGPLRELARPALEVSRPLGAGRGRARARARVAAREFGEERLARVR